MWNHLSLLNSLFCLHSFIPLCQTPLQALRIFYEWNRIITPYLSHLGDIHACLFHYFLVYSAYSKPQSMVLSYFPKCKKYIYIISLLCVYVYVHFRQENIIQFHLIYYHLYWLSFPLIGYYSCSLNVVLCFK